MPLRRSDNPFTPTFGGLPERFFGRSDVIARVGHALAHPQSPDAALFITGPRGCGKTALLERLSGIAKASGWLVIDVHSLSAVDSIMRQLSASGMPIETKASPQVTLPGGIELSIAAATASPTVSGDLIATLVQRASSLSRHKGVFVTVDEIQKISEVDMEQICAATQMARRKGLPVAIMLAGLPGSKELVASYKGCTFMQRVEDIHLGSLLIDETVSAFEGLLSLVEDINAPEDVVWALASTSQGYPYLIQLVGFHFVETLRELYPVGTIEPQAQEVIGIDDLVYDEYRSNVLVPSVKGLKAEGRAYLKAMATLLDTEGFASTGAIARALGKDTRRLSSCRQTLLDRRLILSGGRGKVCYGLPYLSRFSTETAPEPPVDFTGRFVPR